MGDKSHIQWTEATWNFVTGCTKVSKGCLNCYIERTPPFRMAGRKFDKAAIGGRTNIVIHEDRLAMPLRWTRPRLIFTNSLSDLFHEDVPDGIIAAAFAVMSRAKQHTFQVLTKRHGRMRSLLNSQAFWIAVNAERLAAGVSVLPGGGPICLPNVWVGVTVADQDDAALRIPALLDTPAAVRWLSCEPLVGPVTLTRIHSARGWRDGQRVGGTIDALRGRSWMDSIGGEDINRIDWVIVGGESGPPAKATPLDTEPAVGLRDMDLDWVRSLIGECRAAGVPAFVKQLGEPWARQVVAAHRKGGDWDEWPSDLRVREYPQPRAESGDANWWRRPALTVARAYLGTPVEVPA